MRIAFMGTPEFSCLALKALLEAGHELVAVYTQPARPKGRGQKAQASPVASLAEDYGLPVFTPENFRKKSVIDAFAALAVDLAVVVAYGQILPIRALEAPRFGCLNIHASLLPRWRGAAPIHRALMAGDEKTGVAIMQMEKGLDTGPVILEEVTAITPQDSLSSLHDRLSEMGAGLIVKALSLYGERAYETGARPVAKIQPLEGVTYAAKIEKEESQIDWRSSAFLIDRKIRALTPFPGAWTMLEGERIKILAGHPVTLDRLQNGPADQAGYLINDQLLVACGEGFYQITQVQRAGKKAQNHLEFLRGFAVRAEQYLPLPFVSAARSASKTAPEI